MKKLFSNIFGRRTVMALMSLLFTNYIAVHCAAAGISTTDLTSNSWDFVISGSGQQGIAFLSFDKDGFVNGPILLAPKPVASSATGRNIGGDTGRDNTGSNTNSQTILFGWTLIENGRWMLDAKSNIIGFFTLEHSEPQVTCTTNFFLDGTNIIETVDCQTNVIGDAISFVAKGNSKRLTLVSSTPNGPLTFRGIPLVATTNSLDRTWTGVKKENGQLFNELFTLETISDNTYLMTGAGPGYTYDDGVCLVSSQKRIGFALLESGNLGSSTNKTLRATVGTFNSKTLEANTTGLKAPTLTISFKASPAP